MRDDNNNADTVYEADKTICDNDTTVPESDMTVPDNQTADGDEGMVFIEKGTTLIDTYRVESDAIEGGMGKVWRVRHSGWNVDLAMKQPKAQLFQSQQHKDNFIHECEAWIGLGLHPHIVSCYYVREINGTPTIFSEWMDGGSLKNAIESGSLYNGSVAEQQERLLDIAIQFARGLHYAHECRDENGQPMGLIHQDVKPDNLLLTKTGEAKVADFGISKARAVLTMPEGGAEVIADGETMYSASGGYTPAYCSMEQMNGQRLTRRTDIYSWAVSVMEMYLGERLWTNGIIAGAACESYFSDARVTIPDEIKALLKECLNEDEAKRPHDFAVVEEQLLAIYKAETGNDYPRPVPKAAADTADSLNNRALSFLDLGKPEEAEKCWEKAHRLDGKQIDVVFNQTLYNWRHGRITDLEALERIKAEIPETKARALAEALLKESGNDNAASVFSNVPLWCIPIQGKVEEACLWGNELLFFCNGFSKQELIHVGLKDGHIERDDCPAISENNTAGIRKAALSGDGRIALFSMYGGRLYVYDTKARCVLWEPECKDGSLVNRIKLNHNGTIAVAVTSKGNTDKIWFYNTLTKQLVKCASRPHTTSLNPSISYVDDDTVLYDTTTAKEGIAALNVMTGRQYTFTDLKKSGMQGRLYHSSIRSGGKYHVFITDTETIAHHTSSTGKNYTVLPNSFLWAVSKLAIDPPYVYTHIGKRICVYDMRSGSCVRSVTVDVPGNVLLDTVSRQTICWSADDKEINVKAGAFIEPPSPQSASPWRLSRITATAERLLAQKRLDALQERFRDAYRRQDIEQALSVYEEARTINAFIGTAAHRCIGRALGKVCKATGIRSCVKLWEVPADHTAVGFSKQSDMIYGLNRKNGEFSVYDSENGKRLCAAQLDRGEYLDILHAVPGGVCVFDAKLAMCRFNINKEEIKLAAQMEPRGNGKFRAAGHDGRYMLVQNQTTDDKNSSYKAALVDTQTGKEKKLYYHWYNFGDLNYASFLPGERRAFVSMPNSSYPAILDIEQGTLQPVEGFGDRNCYAFYNQHKCCTSADGRLAAVYFNPIREDKGNRMVTVAELEQHRQILELLVEDTDCRCLKFTPDGRFLFLAMYSYTPAKNLLLVDMQTKREIPVAWIDRMVEAADISPDGSFVCALKHNWETKERMLTGYWLEYEYAFEGFADWDEGARPYLDEFLAYNQNWTDEDFDGLIAWLQNGGFGWLRSDGVRAKLSELSKRMR